MASPKPQVSDSAASPEELSEVQVIDSSEPLVTSSSSGPFSSARVLDSVEPLVPTLDVQVLDSDEPLVSPCCSSAEPVAGSSGVRRSSSAEPVVGPSGMAALMPALSSSEDEEAPPGPTPSGSSGRRVNPYSEELK